MLVKLEIQPKPRVLAYSHLFDTALQSAKAQISQSKGFMNLTLAFECVT
jgi:hypothetical protein